ncbi:MAG: leucine-rich repeat domain-containing protein, partial [Prevotella sp.]|nr:leucine-rich repeat domain-containing protein [Candidatus Equicola stercoris]
MKKIKKIFMLGLFCMVSIGASAYDFEVDGIFYNITSTTELTCAVTCKSVSTSNPYTGAVNIPSSVTYDEKTYSVTGVDKFAFVNCFNLTSVTIPNTVTSIGNFAFMWCVKLTSVTIPNSVTFIGDGIFQNCEGLSSVTISDNVTSIGMAAFDGCKNLISVAIPESVTSIGKGAFERCSGLTSVTIPKSVKSIGERVFYGCSGLTSMIVDAENKVYDSRDNSNAIIETATNTLITGCQNTIIPTS